MEEPVKLLDCYKILICLLGLSVVSVPALAQDEQAAEGQALLESLEVPEDQPDDPAKVKIIYFTSSSCDECLKVKKAMPELVAGFEDFIYIRKYDIDQSVENLAKLLTALEEYGLKNTAPPVMFIADKAIVGDKKIIDTLQEVIISAITGEPIPDDPIEEPNIAG